MATIDTDDYDFEQLIDDKKLEGWELERREGNRAVMVKRRYGGILGHFLILILFGFWTFCIPNIIYLFYNYYKKSDWLVLRRTRTGNAQQGA